MTYRAINATSQTITNLLKTHLESDPALKLLFDSGLGGSMVVSPRTPQEMEQADNTGLSVWLYRIARDPELMNYPKRRTGFDTYEYRPLPLRLHYLMTPVVTETDTSANDPGIEQFIIGKVLQTLHDHPQVKGSLLRGDLVNTDTTLTFRLEPLGLEEITRVWDALESSYQLCISYEVSMVMITSDQEQQRITPVKKVEPEYGVVTGESS